MVRLERRRCERTSERSDGGPRGVRAVGPNNPSLSANKSGLCPASLWVRTNPTRIQDLRSHPGASILHHTELLLAKIP